MDNLFITIKVKIYIYKDLRNNKHLGSASKVELEMQLRQEENKIEQLNQKVSEILKKLPTYHAHKILDEEHTPKTLKQNTWRTSKQGSQLSFSEVLTKTEN